MCTRLKEGKQRGGDVRRSLQALISDNLRGIDLALRPVDHRSINERLLKKNPILLRWRIIADNRIRSEAEKPRGERRADRPTSRDPSIDRDMGIHASDNAAGRSTFACATLYRDRDLSGRFE